MLQTQIPSNSAYELKISDVTKSFFFSMNLSPEGLKPKATLVLSVRPIPAHSLSLVVVCGQYRPQSVPGQVLKSSRRPLRIAWLGRYFYMINIYSKFMIYYFSRSREKKEF